MQKFCKLNFHNLTPTTKLSENKAHAKISGNTVCLSEDSVGAIYSSGPQCNVSIATKKSLTYVVILVGKKIFATRPQKSGLVRLYMYAHA